ncbi:MAG: ABC transporter ATP-binding protein [Desulfatiglans sp.]|jgi:branched-chain amino acid transport system ATP-binding protein|nr:ABC transporter ATP-binding protein [Thermodesulfobacteriota bacterium]MEE4353924.1 ABC transporter ATP-binding protein [Desulfatiglans sp.]
MLQVNNIEVDYHRVMLALRGVTLEVADGTLVALLGANGAGKSTTLKAVSGLLYSEVGRVSRGNIQWDGQEIHHLGPEAIARMGIIQVLEGRRVLQHLSIEENLLAAGYILDDRKNLKQGIEHIYSYFPRLKVLRHKAAGYVSGGEQQMMVMGRALVAQPKLMMLDEPSLGLSPILVEEIFEIVKRINSEEKTSILLVEQNASIALELASYGYVMEMGKVVLDGPSDELMENQDVKEFYLGFGRGGEKRNYRDIKHYKRRKRWLG